MLHALPSIQSPTKQHQPSGGFSVRKDSAKHAEDYITKLKQNLVTAVRRESLAGAAINRDHSNSYQISGMYTDNSMHAQQKKLI